MASSIYTDTLETTEVIVDEAEQAVACGRLGCRETTDLVRAAIDEIGTRVVCVEHLEELVESVEVTNE